MTKRGKELQEILEPSFIGKNICNEFIKENHKLMDEDIDLYLYVVEAHSVEKLEAVYKQPIYLKEVTNYNYQNYKEIVDNVEAVLKKILYLVDSDGIEKYKKFAGDKAGLVNLCRYMGLIDEEYFEHIYKDNMAKFVNKVSRYRNDSTHEAPISDPTKIAEMIWKALYIEFGAIKRYKKKLREARERVNISEYENVLKKYAEIQISKYEEEQAQGFKYVQIEYENTLDPENDGYEADFTVIKGTAETLMSSICFEETPSVKLIADAGMGKTKMMEYINYMLMKGFINKTNNVFPIIIYCNDVDGDLREYSFEKTINGKFNVFLRDINCEHIFSNGLIEYIVSNHKVMFLFDGLNEINKGKAEKSRFIKSLSDNINIYINKGCYFLMTERYSRGTTTINKNVVFYKLSEISDEIKMEFFKAKGNKTLIERLSKISNKYDSETQKEMNQLLRKPFYLAKFCELADSLNNIDDSKWPKNRFELMSFFVKELINREKSKGEIIADYQYITFYLSKLADLLTDGYRLSLSSVLRGFKETTDYHGLNSDAYSSDHIIDLLQQLGFIRCSGDYVYINDVYKDYFDELLIESWSL